MTLRMMVVTYGDVRVVNLAGCAVLQVAAGLVRRAGETSPPDSQLRRRLSCRSRLRGPARAGPPASVGSLPDRVGYAEPEHDDSGTAEA
jgi:hypothetical protein